MPSSVKRIVILGATSAIAEATARIWAREGARFVLVGRNKERLAAIAADLRQRGAGEAISVDLDCAKADARAALGEMVTVLGGLDVLLLAYGVLGDQARLTSNAS